MISIHYPEKSTTTMETSRRDIFITLVACLIVVAVLLPAIIINNGSNSKNHDSPSGTRSSAFFTSFKSTTKRQEDIANKKTAVKIEQRSDRSLIKAEELLNEYPLIDGHNDFPYSVREILHNDISELHMDCDLAHLQPWASDDTSQTDLGRLRRGQVGAQFWSAYIGCEEARAGGALRMFIEQIDVIKQIVAKYPGDLEFADSEAGVKAAWERGRIASLIGVEGGHAIEDSLAALRSLYQLGVR